MKIWFQNAYRVDIRLIVRVLVQIFKSGVLNYILCHIERNLRLPARVSRIKPAPKHFDNFTARFSRKLTVTVPESHIISKDVIDNLLCFYFGIHLKLRAVCEQFFDLPVRELIEVFILQRVANILIKRRRLICGELDLIRAENDIVAGLFVDSLHMVCSVTIIPPLINYAVVDDTVITKRLDDSTSNFVYSIVTVLIVHIVKSVIKSLF